MIFNKGTSNLDSLSLELSLFQIPYQLLRGHNQINNCRRQNTRLERQNLDVMLLLILLSPLVVVATSSWGPKHKRCPTLLAAATQFDLDNSGGLDQSEFSNFLSAIASGSSGTVSATLFKEKEEAAYNLLLCQCYHVFGLHMSCCDNTTTEKSSSMWKEVSLDALATDEDSIKMGRKSYDKVFCEEMMWLMDETGMILATNLTSIDVSATTTAATTSTAATTHSLVESINTAEPTLSPDDAVTAATPSSAAAAAAVTTIPTTIPTTTGLIVSSSSSSSESNAVDSLYSSITDSKSIQASGFAVGGIIALVLAMTLIAFIIAALIVANKRRSNNKRCVLKEDSNLSEDIENNYAINAKADVDVDNWHDNDDNDAGQGAGASSRSSLAAMGVASLVTTQWSVSGGGGMDTSNIDDDLSYIGSIVEEVDNCNDKPMGI